MGVVGGGVGGIVGGARNRGRGDPALGTGKCKVQLRSPMRGLLRLRPLDTDIHPKHTHTDIQTKKSCSTDCCAPPFLTCSSRTRTPCAQGQSQSRGSSSRGQTAQHTGGGGRDTRKFENMQHQGVTNSVGLLQASTHLRLCKGQTGVKPQSNNGQTTVKHTCMPSTNTRLSSAVFDSSMVTTPWRPTLAMASAIS